jgi:hypothetical protein
MKIAKDSIFCDTKKEDYCFLRENFSDKMIDRLVKQGYLDRPSKCEYGIMFDTSDGCAKNCVRKQIISKHLNAYLLEQTRCLDDLKFVKETESKAELGDLARRFWDYELLSSVFPVVFKKYEKDLHHKKLFEECANLAKRVREKLNAEMNDFNMDKCSLVEKCKYYRRAGEIAKELISSSG